MRARHAHGDDQIRALWRHAAGFADSYDDMNLTPPHLATITARTLIVYGDRDPLYPIEMALEMYRAIPHAALRVVPGGGHGPIFGEREGAELRRNRPPIPRALTRRSPERRIRMGTERAGGSLRNSLQIAPGRRSGVDLPCNVVHARCQRPGNRLRRRRPARRRRNGRADARDRLVVHRAGPGRQLAPQPAHLRAHRAHVTPADVRLVGQRAHQPLQRRLQDHRRRQAPAGAGAAGACRVARDLGRDRPAGRGGHAPQRRRVRKGAPADHGAQRVRGRDLLHVLVQPGSRRRGRCRRHHLRQHRRHREDRGRAPGADAPRPGRAHQRRAQRRDRLCAGRRKPRSESVRPPLRAALPDRRRSAERATGRARRDRRRARGGAGDDRARRRR